MNVVSPKFYKINSLTSLFHETFLTSIFRNDDTPKGLTLRPDALRRCNVQDRRFIHGSRTHQGFTGIQALHHDKTILDAHKVMKLHKRDTTSSYDEFPRYARSFKLIPTTSTTHLGNNDTPDLYSEEATLSKFIHEGRPTTTKPTPVALPSFTSHSTFCECSKGILYPARTYHHSPLTRPVVTISYSLRQERKITLLSTSIIHWKTKRESTPKKLIYSTSRSGTTFQVGIRSSNSLIKLR